MNQLLAVMLVAGCARFDLDDPIQLVPPRDWPATDIDAVARAAACWNLGFGARFEVVTEPSAEQIVVIDFNAFACWGTAGVFTPGDQARIDICPHPLYSSDLFVVFAIVLHELGHAAGIRDEASGERSVMGGNFGAVYGYGGHTAFSAEDRALFEDANGDRDAPCADVELVGRYEGMSFCQCPD